MVSRRLFLLWFASGAQLLCTGALSATPKQQGSVLVVGASGGTGLRALNGLLDVGYQPQQIRVMSRNQEKLQNLKQQYGFDTCQANLDDPDTLNEAVFSNCVGCYIHSTSSDTKQLDTCEEDRAQNLAKAIELHAKKTLNHVVYNSAAGEPDHGVYRIQQKHNVETIFFQHARYTKFTSLRANLFMEELWKTYTRPAILKGVYPFGVPGNRDIYLTSVRDMGRLAGACLASPETTCGRIINVAGDCLTADEIAAAFSKAQGSPCVHKQSRLLGFISRIFFRDLYQIIRFYKRSTETTDIPALREEFPNLLTNFETFLNETNWGDRNLTFEDLSVIMEQPQE